MTLVNIVNFLRDIIVYFFVVYFYSNVFRMFNKFDHFFVSLQIIMFHNDN